MGCFAEFGRSVGQKPWACVEFQTFGLWSVVSYNHDPPPHWLHAEFDLYTSNGVGVSWNTKLRTRSLGMSGVRDSLISNNTPLSACMAYAEFDRRRSNGMSIRTDYLPEKSGLLCPAF